MRTRAVRPDVGHLAGSALDEVVQQEDVERLARQMYAETFKRLEDPRLRDVVKNKITVMYGPRPRRRGLDDPRRTHEGAPRAAVGPGVRHPRRGVPREVCELALAHVNGDRVEAAYWRSDLFERRRTLMQQWADYLAAQGGAHPLPSTDRVANTPYCAMPAQIRFAPIRMDTRLPIRYSTMRTVNVPPFIPTTSA